MNGEGEAVQDFYPDDLSHCYGCGRLNEHGLQIKSRWQGESTRATYLPRPHQTAIPGIVYGGLIASLIDCHGTGSAALAGYRAEGRPPGSLPPLRYVTASLHVDFVRPTPLGPELVLTGWIDEITERKVVVSVEVEVEGEVCTRGKVVAVKMPDSMRSKE